MNFPPSIVVVIAPQGVGKTRNARTLADMFGCTQIIDEWDGVAPIPAGALVLASSDCVDIHRLGRFRRAIARIISLFRFHR